MATSKTASKDAKKRTKPPTRNSLTADLSAVVEQLINPLYQRLDSLEKRTTITPLVFMAMKNVMADIEPIAKAHTHQEKDFKFRMIDEVCSVIQPLLVKHGLLILPEVLERGEVERMAVAHDGQSFVQIFSVVRTRWHIRSAMDGSAWPDPCITMGEGMSDQHFSTAAAQTMAYKQMLWEVFCIPVHGGDDPEAYTGEKSQASIPKTVYYAPEAKLPAPDQTPSLFDHVPEPASSEKKSRRRGKLEPQVMAVGGAALPKTETAAPLASEEPLKPQFKSILEINMKRNNVTDTQLFEHFKVENWAGLKQSDMEAALAFVTGPKTGEH